MKKHYERVLLDADNRVDKSFAMQVMLPEDSFDFGGFRDNDYLVEPKFAIYRVTTMIACYFNHDSKWFGNKDVYDRVLLGLAYIKRAQRENGFFDLINCNFYSGPDTAFCIKRMLPVYCYLLYHEASSESEKIINLMKPIIYSGATAIMHGGFHTPNHRWAIASALTFCSHVFKEQKFADAAIPYLNEGIDCNSDGEYAERSAGNYNRICNDAMIMLAVATGDDKYYEYAARNLNMMLLYIEPDDSIFTNNSTRQDRGNKIYPKDYYFEYLYLGYKLHNEKFLKAANYIMSILDEHNLTSMDCLIHFMNLPELISFEYEGCGIEKSYSKHFKDSNLVRCRINDYSYSIVNQSSSFLYFQHKALTVSVKIGGSFCEHRAFVPDLLVPEDNGYHLSQTMVGWYYLPFDEPQDTTDWWKMNNAGRKKLLGPNLEYNVDVVEAENGVDLHIKTSGIDRAPLRIELAFDGDCLVENNINTIQGAPGSCLLVKSGDVRVTKDDSTITVGPAFGAHQYTAGKFGSESRNPYCFTVYFTDFTCFDHVISFRKN